MAQDGTTVLGYVKFDEKETSYAKISTTGDNFSIYHEDGKDYYQIESGSALSKFGVGVYLGITPNFWLLASYWATAVPWEFKNGQLIQLNSQQSLSAKPYALDAWIAVWNADDFKALHIEKEFVKSQVAA